MNCHRLQTYYICIYACLLVALSSTGVVSAAPTTSSITITPTSTQITLQPGDTAQRSFDIINSGDLPYVVTTSVAPYSVQGDRYAPRFRPLPGMPTVTSWIQLTSTRTTIDAHKMNTAGYTIRIPPGTPAGGYYAVLLAEATPITQSSTGIMARNRVGDILYLTVGHPALPRGTVAAPPSPFVTFSPMVAYNLNVTDVSDVHFLADVSTSIKSILGTQLYSESSARYVLPHTTRLISGEWSSSEPIGVYRIQQFATIAGIKQPVPERWIIVITPWVVHVSALVILLGILLYNMLWFMKKRTRTPKSVK